MNLKNYYWYFEKALSTEFCDKVIKLGKSLQRKKALTGTANKYTKEVQKIRKSNVAWLNEQWIYDEILPYVNTANKNANWNFEIDSYEECQFTKYGMGQFKKLFMERKP